VECVCLGGIKKQINPRALGSWSIKGTGKSTLGKDYSIYIPQAFLSKIKRHGTTQMTAN